MKSLNDSSSFHIFYIYPLLLACSAAFIKIQFYIALMFFLSVVTLFTFSEIQPMKKIIFVLLAAAFVAVEASQSGLGPEFEAFRDVLSHHEETENDTTRDIYAGRRQLQGGAFERSTPLLAATFGGEPGFHHSVASGDPLPDAVIIWYVRQPLGATE
jgi:hypothetical protein